MVAQLLHTRAENGGTQGQQISNTLWAAATMRVALSAAQVDALLASLEPHLADATRTSAQCISNTLWALATLRASAPTARLTRLFAALASRIESGQAEPQCCANAMWAAGSLVPPIVPEPLLRPTVLRSIIDGMVPHMKPQELANVALACALLGLDAVELMPAVLERVCALVAAGKGGSEQFEQQGLANALWAIAVLDLRECVGDAAVLVRAMLPLWPLLGASDMVQLWQAHAWLADCGLSVVQGNDRGSHGTPAGAATPGAGLRGLLNDQQLAQCRGAWESMIASTSHVSTSQAVLFEAAQRIPGLADVQLEALCAPDQLLRVDISASLPAPAAAALAAAASPACAGGNAASAARAAAAEWDNIMTAAALESPAADEAGMPHCTDEDQRVDVLLAIEFDGPFHFCRPGNTLTGSTRYRNRALAARGYTVVPISWCAGSAVLL